MSALRRVGHKGADLIAPGNTRESFDAALEAGVDMIEFDVLPAALPADDDTPLILAHDHEHLTAEAPSLDEGLEHLKSDAFADVELDVDLKLPGYEERVVRALQEHDLVDRTLVSSQYMRSLVKIRAIEPGLRLGWSVPRVRRDYTKSIVFVVPALSALVHSAGSRVVHAGVRGADGGPGAGVAGDRDRRARADLGAHRLGQDAGRVPVGAGPAGRGADG